MPYAQNTSVSNEQSRMEIERTLRRYGASGFAYASQPGRALVAFTMANRQVRFILPLPDMEEDRFVMTPTQRKHRTQAAQYDAWEQECRRCWRALGLVVKAKLEAIETGIATFDEEFMAHIVLPSGGTVGDFMLPQVASAYAHGTLPAMLPGLEG